MSLVRKQKVRDIYWNESVSRTLGRKIRLEMASTASVSGNFQLQHIVTKSGDVEVIDTKPLGSVDIKHDYGHMRVPEAMVKNPHAVRLIAPRMFDG